jgi:hypothetical protein
MVSKFFILLLFHICIYARWICKLIYLTILFFSCIIFLILIFLGFIQVILLSSMIACLLLNISIFQSALVLISILLFMNFILFFKVNLSISIIDAYIIPMILLILVKVHFKYIYLLNSINLHLFYINFIFSLFHYWRI